MRSIEIEKTQLEDFKSAEAFSVAEDKTVLINNVFGINNNGMLPARFLSGFLSTFSLARTIQEVSDGDINPQVRIFRPINITQHINGISDEATKRQIKQGNKMLQSLAFQHFSTIDFFIEDDLPITENALQVLLQVASLIDLHCDKEVIGKIRESGRIRGGEQGAQNALIYAAHHPFGWIDLHHPSIFREVPPHVIINTLPPSEKKYTEVRKRLEQIIGGSGSELIVPIGTRQELVINMCGTPHYIFLEDEKGNRQEPSIDEVLSITCAEVLDDMRRRFKSEQNIFLKENLRRACRDLERVFSVFAKGDKDALAETTVGSLMERGES